MTENANMDTNSETGTIPVADVRVLAGLQSSTDTALYLIKQVEIMQDDLTSAYWKAIEARSAVAAQYKALLEAGTITPDDIPHLPYPNGGWSCAREITP